MKSFLRKMLSLQEGEGTRVALLLIMGFLLGMFLATITVASSSLFLANFVEEESLPKAFLLSGVIGLLATVTYNFLQNRIPFALLAGLSILAMVLLTALLEFGGSFFPDPRDLYFTGFTLIIPFTFIVNLVFWGSFGRLFNTRQSKRLLSTVDAGSMIATFVAYFSIPQILKAIESESSLYAISVISITLYLLLFIYLSTRHLNKVRTFQEEKTFYMKVTVKSFFGNRYLLYMSAFVIVSMLVMNFVDYSFLNVTTLMMAEKDYARFISYFGMTVVIFNFLFQTFATERIVNEYGMRVAMLINPMLIGLFTLAAIFVGYYFGHSQNASQFVVFFICIAMSKLFISSLRDALDNQTFRLYLLPLDQTVRIDVQTKIEGMVTALATLLAGAIIILLNTLKIVDFFSITVLTFPLVGIWYFISNRLNQGYRHTLHNTLAYTRPSGSLSERAFTVTEALTNGLDSPTEERVIYALKLMEELEPAHFESVLVTLANSDSARVRAFVRERASSAIGSHDGRSEIRDLAAKAYEHSYESDLIDISTERLLRLSKSKNPQDRILASRAFPVSSENQMTLALLELLRDPFPDVRIAALNAARRVKNPDTWPFLTDLLKHPTYCHHAAAALVAAGDGVLPLLENAFNKAGQDQIAMLRIVQIMGRIGSDYAMKLLWRKAEYPDKRIVRQILYSMRCRNYQAEGNVAQEVTAILDMEIGKTIWNLSAIHELPQSDGFIHLREALEEEVSVNYDQITLLLSLLYDPQSVQMVKENIASGDPDGTAFALELMDMFIEPSLKPRLFPLFDDSSIEEKLRQLQLFYPREIYNPVQVVNYLLNRDFDLTNRWTRACAIHAAAFMPEFRVSRGLIAQMFNPDRLLQEAAAWVIYHKDRNAYEAIATRLTDADKKYLDSSLENNRLLNGLEDGFFLDIEMVMFIKQLPNFRGVHGVQISELASCIEPLDLNRDKELSFVPDERARSIFIVAHGAVCFNLQDGGTIDLPGGAVYGDLFQDGNVTPVLSVKAMERSIVFKINIADFYLVMVNNHQLIEGLIRNLTPGTVNTPAKYQTPKST